MPIIGLGTWKSTPGKVGPAVEHALSKCGYSHIDCAAIYRNEKEIGNAFQKVFAHGTRKRDDVFVTSKLWNSEHLTSRVREACESTLVDLKLDYLDLYLMHWGIAIPPNGIDPALRWKEQLDENGFLITEKISIQETWQAMEELVSAGLVKAIGIANFTAPMIIDLLSYAKVLPVVNQIELHPYLPQQELVEFCQRQNIVVTAYSPLGSPGNYKSKGFPVLTEDETIIQLARNHGKSSAQILIRWGVQRNTVVIPKSITPERIRENMNVFDFELSETEMQAITKLNRNLRFVNPYAWWKIPYFS